MRDSQVVFLKAEGPPNKSSFLVPELSVIIGKAEPVRHWQDRALGVLIIKVHLTLEYLN